jgi:hypothetical protein
MAVLKEAVIKVVTAGLAQARVQLQSLQDQAAKLAAPALQVAARTRPALTALAEVARKAADLAKVPVVVRFAAAGAEAVQSAGAMITNSIDTLKKKLDPLTGAARGAFLGITAAVTGLVAAADPVRFTVFTQLLLVLAQEVGRIFIPVLQAANEVLLDLIKWFKSLTPETRVLIRQITVVAAVVTAAVAGFGLLAMVAAKVAAVAAVVFTKVGAIVAALAAVAAGIALVAGKGDLLQGVKRIFAGLADIVSRVWAVVGPVLSRIRDAAVGLASALGTRLEAPFQRLQDAAQRIWAVIGPVLERVWSWLGRIAELVGGVLATVVVEVFTRMAEAVALVAEWVAALYEAVGPLLTAAVELADAAFNSFLDTTVTGLQVAIEMVNALIRAMNRLNPLFKISEIKAPKLSGPERATPAEKVQPKELGPMAAPLKVQSVGLEELQKKVQASVNGALSPEKIAEQNLKEAQRNNQLQKEGNDFLKQIYQGIRGPSYAQLG